MRARVWIYVAVAGLTAAVGFLPQRFEPVGLSLERAERASQSSALVGDQAAAILETRRTAKPSSTESADQFSRCSIAGRIVDVAGTGLQGATVVLRSTRHRAVSDDEGRFVLCGVVATPTARLAVTRDSMASYERGVTLWPATQIELGDLVLHSEAVIRGRVVTRDGRVRRATVTVDGRAAGTTDETGAFELRALAAGRHRVSAHADGYSSPRDAVVDLAAGSRREDLVLRLDRAHVLRGRIFSKHGVAIAGAAIEARMVGARSSLSVHSDESGRFSIGPLQSGKAVVSVTHSAFVAFGRKYATDAQNVRITMTPTRAIVGRVVDEQSGRSVAVARARLLVSSESDAGPWRALGESVTQISAEASQGRFRIPVGIHTTARVLVLSETHAPVMSAAFWIGSQEGPPLVLRARAGIRLRGALEDDRGHPVSGATVTVLAARGATALVQTGEAVTLAEQRSDHEGRFVTTPLRAGRYRIRVRRSGYAHVERPIVVGARSAKPIRLVIDRAGTIRGRVIGEASERRLRVTAIPVNDAGATPVDERHRHASSIVRDRSFVLDALRPGQYRLELRGLARDELHVSPPEVLDVAVEKEIYVEIGG